MNLAKSMTGFAEASVESGQSSVTVTIRSVNHRSLDLKLRVPAQAARLEAGIRRKVRQQVRRGSVQINLEVRADGSSTASVNRAAVEARLEAFRQIAELCGTDARPDPNVVIGLPGTFEPLKSKIPDDQLTALVAACLDEALPAFDRARVADAQPMVSDISRHADAIEAEVNDVAQAVDRVVEVWREEFGCRLQELLSDVGVDRDRIAQEAAHQATRSDVTEELLRLRAHVDGLRECLENPPEIGKRIDFLAQEMNREANTLLSKTQSLGANALGITEAGLRIRRSVEKIREQAMNLE